MQSDYEELFRQAKELIKDELSSIAYDTWILPLKLVSIDDERITIRSNTDYNANFLVIEKCLLNVIQWKK